MGRWHRRAVITGVGLLAPFALLATAEVSCVGMSVLPITPDVDSSLPTEDSAIPRARRRRRLVAPSGRRPGRDEGRAAHARRPADVQPHDATSDTSLPDAADAASPDTGTLDAGPAPTRPTTQGLPRTTCSPRISSSGFVPTSASITRGRRSPFPFGMGRHLRTRAQRHPGNAASQPLLHTTTPLTGTASALPWLEFTPGTGDGTGDDAGASGLLFNVDLSFLANAGYTIFVVASRHTDKGRTTSWALTSEARRRTTRPSTWVGRTTPTTTSASSATTCRRRSPRTRRPDGSQRSASASST